MGYGTIGAKPTEFIKPLISFINTYGFDGVEIDREYPSADDRSGRVEDFANFPSFIANLKAALARQDIAGFLFQYL